MKKRMICAVLSVAMILGLLSGCSFGKAKSKALGVGYNEDGSFLYTVVRAVKASPDVEEAAKNLRSVLKSGLDCKINIIKDASIEDYDGNYEILIGDTDREASALAKEHLKENRVANSKDFIIEVIGDKVCIQAMNDKMLVNACSWFADTFCDSPEDWQLLTSDYRFLYGPEENVVANLIAGVDLGKFTVVKPKEFSYLIGLEVEDFVDYYESLGFTTDYVAEPQKETAYEVLIGDTSRKESKAVSVQGDNYVITVTGGKLVIKGGSDLATREGVRAFNRAVKEAVKTGTPINWSEGYVFNGRYDPNAEDAYTLNWGDEFDYSGTFDLAKWGDYNRASTKLSGESCLGGKTFNVDWMGRSLYTEKTGKALPNQNMIYVSDGSLHLGGIYDGDVNFIGTYASSYATMIYKYGFTEIRGKWPVAPWCVSYWVNGSVYGQEFQKRFGDQERNCMTEIDIVENFGKVESFASNVHRWWSEYRPDGTQRSSAHNSMDGNPLYTGKSLNNKKYTYPSYKKGKDDLSSDFHTYSFYWDEYCMKFAFDGKTYCDYEYEENLSVSVHALMNYLILSCGGGGASYGETFQKETDAPYVEHLIDFVRIYQTGSKNSQLITAWPQEEQDGTRSVRYPENTSGLQF